MRKRAKKKVVEIGPGLEPILPKRRQNKMYLVRDRARFLKEFPKLKAKEGMVQHMPFKPNSISKIEAKNVLSAPKGKGLKGDAIVNLFVTLSGKTEEKVLQESFFEGSRKGALAEIYKVLKPEGKLVLTSSVKGDEKRFQKVINNALVMGFRKEHGFWTWIKSIGQNKKVNKITLIKK